MLQNIKSYIFSILQNALEAVPVRFKLAPGFYTEQITPQVSVRWTFYFINSTPSFIRTKGPQLSRAN